VNDVFTPSAEEIRRAAAVVRTAERARSRGEVAVLDEDGRFVDPAVVERARVVLGLAASVPRGGDR
jgi:citrate lyase subunit beta/citryl-CoA lyase